jgi:hypothetical protein
MVRLGRIRSAVRSRRLWLGVVLGVLVAGVVAVSVDVVTTWQSSPASATQPLGSSGAGSAVASTAPTVIAQAPPAAPVTRKPCLAAKDRRRSAARTTVRCRHRAARKAPGSSAPH